MNAEDFTKKVFKSFKIINACLKRLYVFFKFEKRIMWILLRN